MRDTVSIERVSKLHPKIREEVALLIDKAEAGFPANVKIRVVQGLRTIEEQNGLYALGRSKVNPDGKSKARPLGNIVTNAKGGKSYHNYGLAIDFAIIYSNVLSWDIMVDKDNDGKRDWLEVVEIFKAAGYEFGGDWKSLKDYPHLQKTFGYTVGALFQKWILNDFIEDSKVYLDL